MSSNITILDISLRLRSGFGAYKIVVDFEVDGMKHKKTFNINDSELWDNRGDKTKEELLLYIGGEEALLNSI